jgi:hypothetical protein
VGLAGFALALALVEQIVLETNLANVSRGSRVYESGHVSGAQVKWLGGKNISVLSCLQHMVCKCRLLARDVGTCDSVQHLHSCSEGPRGYSQ